MSEDRLELIAPDLSSVLAAASLDERRAAAIAASRFAIERTGLDDRTSHEILRSLGVGIRDQARRDQLQQLIDALDERQWDLQEAVRRGDADESSHLEAFSKARAANAVWFAMDDDTLNAAREAIYEANAATDDLPALRHVVLRALKRD